MRYKTLFLLLLLSTFLYPFPATASPSGEEEELLEDLENVLAEQGQIVLNGETEDQRRTANKIFNDALKRALDKEGAFEYPFKTVKNLSILLSDDEEVRVYNWNLPLDDGTYEYFGFIQHKAKRTVKTFELTDHSDSTGNPSTATLTPSNWYGALYYDIIYEKKVGKKYYTLLGWDGNNELTTKKIIEVLYFKNGKPRFGDYIFEEPKIKRKRVIFEYSNDVAMSLKYHKKRKQIVFDFLAPSRDDFEGIYEYYGPVLNRFDAFEVDRGHWKYVKDIDIKGERRKNDKYYNEKPNREEKELYDQ